MLIVSQVLWKCQDLLVTTIFFLNGEQINICTDLKLPSTDTSKDQNNHFKESNCLWRKAQFVPLTWLTEHFLFLGEPKSDRRFHFGEESVL